MTRFDSFVERAARYYSAKFAVHGPTARGVDWNSAASQELRFEQLMRVHDEARPFTINDYGCGYGALVSYLRSRGFDFKYVGFDVSEVMVEYARSTHASAHDCVIVSNEGELSPADYTVASGVFNVKLDADDAAWTEYAVDTVDRLAELSTRGFAFNMLTSYSDPELMRQDLYYGDPRFFFDVCRRRHSRHVALLHDYGLWEWTIVVRRETPAA